MYQDLTREQKILWNVKVIAILVGALGTIPKRLVKRLEVLEIRGRVETIQITTIIKIGQRRVPET